LAVTVTLDAPLERYLSDWVLVSLIRAGSAVIACNGQFKRVGSGDVVAFASGTSIGIEPHDSVTVSTVAIDRDWLIDIMFWRHARVFIDRLQARRHVRRWRKRPVRFGHVEGEQSAVLAACIEKLAGLNEARSPSDGFLHAQIEVFAILDVLTVVLALGTPSLPTPPRPERPSRQSSLPRRRPLTLVRPELRTTAELMRSDPAQHWTVARLAGEVHLSPSWFAHVFSKTFGKPPIVFLTMVRLEKLADLLRTTDDSVAACAHAVGWASTSHAAKQFKRATGMAPCEYRKLPARPSEPNPPH
jgi:AraC-like DNA-binding protein